MSRVYVTNLKARTFTRQTTRAKCRNTTLVSHLGQRIVLIHKLRQLTGTEELFYGCRNRLGVNDVLRHQAFTFNHTQTFTYCTLYSYKTNAEDILCHLTNASDTTVAEVVDIINDADTVTDIDKALQYIEDIYFVENARTCDFIAAKTTVELHTTNRRKIIAIFSKEQVIEQRLSSFLGRRLTRTHHAIDFNLSFQLITGLINADSV